MRHPKTPRQREPGSRALPPQGEQLKAEPGWALVVIGVAVVTLAHRVFGL